MRLRHKLLLSFLLFGVLPLLAMGTRSYVRATRALEGLIGQETSQIAAKVARELEDRLDLQESDQALLGGNEATTRLLRARVAGRIDEARTAEQDMRAYSAEVWSAIRDNYDYVQIRDATGAIVLTLGEAGGEPQPGPLRPSKRALRDPENGNAIGELEALPRLSEMTRTPALERRFGDQGWTAIVNRLDGQVIRAIPDRPVAALDLPVRRMASSRGSLTLKTRDSRFVTSWISLDRPGWLVVAAGSVDEFAGPFVRQRLVDLALLAGVVALVALAFTWLVHRATRPLDALTTAADRIGAGDLSPALPEPGADEVGRLTRAFGTMTTRIREMIAQIEAGRQTAVLGRFAAELSHEIRNPLTSIKINLQGLERDAREGRIPEESRDSIRLALREIRRLDDAVRTALRAGRPPAPPRPFDVSATLKEALALLRPQAASQGVTIDDDSDTHQSESTGDAEAVRGAFVNVVLNAIEAMPSGGTVRVTSRNGSNDAVEIRIADEGPGIPASVRDKVFAPFYTTKEGGTGLGLSLALQTIRAHGGSLTFADPGRGTEVVITLPLRTSMGTA
jgi:signal transduction histidine kinase